MYSTANINILVPNKADVDSLLRSGVNASKYVTTLSTEPNACVVYCVRSNKLYKVFKTLPCIKNVSPETVRQLTLIESEAARIVLAEALGLKRGTQDG